MQPTTRYLALGLVLASTASASTRGHSRRGELARLDNGHATFTFTLATTSIEAEELVQTVELPVGMTATGLTVSIGGSTPSRAITMEPTNGRTTFDEIVRRMKDPALLERTGVATATLRVFPVQRGAPATVVIELTATGLVNAHSLVHLDDKVALLAAPEFDARESEPASETPELAIVTHRVEIAPVLVADRY